MLVITLDKVEVVCVVILSPVVLALLAAIQVYVEATLLVNAILNDEALHTTAASVLVITGVGLTVTLTVCGDPTQLPPVDVGVTVYTTTCALVVLFVMVLFIELVD